MHMVNYTIAGAVALSLTATMSVSVRVQEHDGAHSQPPVTLTDRDRAEIEELVARYGSALGRCAAVEYADLFTPDGVFTTDEFRGAKHRELYGVKGSLTGRAKLIELVQTEEFCLNPAANGASRGSRGNGSRPAPRPVIVPSASGATGTAPLGNGGRYEDVYVKTADGWRFKSRTVFMPPATQ
jgi:hypothetical protein